MIDALIQLLLFVPGVLLLLLGPTQLDSCRVEGDRVVLGGDEPDNAICEEPAAESWVGFGVLSVAALGAAITYWAILEGKRSQTVGKKALGIRTVDQETGQPIGPGRAVGRYFARTLSSAPWCLGYLWMLWDNRRQTFHDKLARSIVVRA